MIILKRYMDLGETFDEKKEYIKKSLRVNTLKIRENVLVKRLSAKGVKLQKIGFVKNGYYYESDFSLGATPEYLQGYYYLQEAASQIPVEILNPLPNDFVLDMTASPGGKTTHMAQLMNNEGTIVALDNDHVRIEKLQNNIERLSVKNVLIYKKDARFSNDLGLKFDKILLDAPCSGNFCVEKDFFRKRSVEDFKNKAKVQKELIRSAFICLKKGGTLVYSTCSLEPEEDEMVIDWLLSNFEDAYLEEINLNIGESGLIKVFGKDLNPELKKTKRFWPHKTGTEGFFIAKVRKK